MKPSAVAAAATAASTASEPLPWRNLGTAPANASVHIRISAHLSSIHASQIKTARARLCICINTDTLLRHHQKAEDSPTARSTDEIRLIRFEIQLSKRRGWLIVVDCRYSEILVHFPVRESCKIFF